MRSALAGADATPALLRIGLTWLLALGVTAATGARHLTRDPVAPPVPAPSPPHPAAALVEPSPAA
jgi:hypothetical protein